MSPIRMSKIESAIRAVLEFTEAFNRHEVAAMMNMTADECTYEHNSQAAVEHSITGKEAITRYWQDFFKDSPDTKLDIEEIFSIGERCILRWKSSQAGADNEPQQVRGVHIYRVRKGLICERISYSNR